MSALLEKLNAIKEQAVAEEGWLTVHKNWVVACLLCLVIGAFLGWKFL